ncbi:hypothetical protein CIRG_06698 [Coccidioides immitis RMSCC 2394]|uniref:N-alpha-acetyltransferase 40 n=1 Tax=Coccidioides immitis RMSCC 2394 TaxID=404692 RepID=A0A0J7BAG1_COCIT|nr:hypothetical protein CIRG_06698 [Coccidioides immitis RMSCC 2394]
MRSTSHRANAHTLFSIMALAAGSDITPQNEARLSTRKRKYQEDICHSASADSLDIDKPCTPRKMNGAFTTKRPRRAKKPCLVETINSLSLDEFINRYVPPNVLGHTIRVQCSPKTDAQVTNAVGKVEDEPHEEYSVEIHTSSTLPKHYFDACFALIKFTSAEAYKNSRNGWSPAKKKVEMKLVDMRYMLLLRKKNEGQTSEVQEQSVEDSDLGGMLSFMTTYEDGLPVLYCYEIHLTPRLQHKGVGKQLMRIYEDIGQNIGLEKAMLTVYKSNKSGIKFYERLGYAEDEFSPRPMKLRNGHVKDFDYMVFSKPLKD